MKGSVMEPFLFYIRLRKLQAYISPQPIKNKYWLPIREGDFFYF